MFENRIKSLNINKINKEAHTIIYWMQRSIRTKYNHALEYAVEMANELKKDLLVIFSIEKNFSDANERSFSFLVESLKDVEKNLKKRGIRFIVVDSISLVDKIIEYSKDTACIITDRAYLKYLVKAREELAEKAEIRVIQVESDVVVPVEITSDKEEYSAKTIRGKINKVLDFYLNKKFEEFKYDGKYLSEIESYIDKKSVKEIINKLNVENSVKKSPIFKGGESEANKVLKNFIDKKLDQYVKFRNHPEFDYQSALSPYLHFGNISPIFIAKEILSSKKDKESIEAFLEELIVRRELAINFIYYNKNYDKFEYMTYSWAYDTMAKHRADKRRYTYSINELEEANTHDIYWNTAQKEMTLTGKMHGYMRMYWAKKIIEWSEDYKNAYEIIKYLNNKYFLDGRDENSYAGIAWCFGKHDRAWKERDVFGKLRYMNSNGLKSKFNIDAYVEKVHNIESSIV